MTVVPDRRTVAATAAAFMLLAGAPSRGAAGPPREPAEVEPLQVIADVVLIETRCRRLNVDYGKLFAYAEAHGIRPVEFLPTGDRRPAFEAAVARRLKGTPADRFCSDLAAERDALVPGVFTTP